MSNDPAKTPSPSPSAEPPMPSLLEDPQVRRFGPIVALLVLAFVFLFPTLRGMYIWDDPQWLLKNTTVQSGTMGLWKVWSDPSTTPHYYPLVFTTYWLEFLKWGLGSVGPDGILRGVGYHVDNLLLHLGAVVLLYEMLRRLKLPGGTAGAWIAAAIWAVHPMTVESVAWVAERKNVLSAVFFFGTMFTALLFFEVIAPAEGKPRPASPRWGLYAASVFLFLCAMLSKTAACFAPPAILVLIWWRRGRISLREILLTVPHFLLAIGFGLLTAYLEKQHVGATGSEFDYSFLQRILIAGNSVLFYIGKLFWPYPVMQIYPRWGIDPHQPLRDSSLYIAPFVVISVGVLLFLLRKKITRGPLAAYLIFVGGLFPVMGFINYYTMVYTFVADHYQYLAGVPVIVLSVEVGLALLRFVATQVPIEKGFKPEVEHARFYKLTGSLLFGGLILSLGALAFGDGSLYQDTRDLWLFNAKYNTSPGAFGVWANLGDTYRDDFHDKPAAFDAFQKSLAFKQDWHTYQALGLLAFDLGDPLKVEGKTVDSLQLGEQYLRQAERLMPDYVRDSRLVAMRQRMMLPNAGIGSGNAAIYTADSLIGQHLMNVGRFDEAIQCFRNDLATVPDNPLDYFYMADCFNDKGDYASAIRLNEQAVTINPSFADAWLHLGLELNAVGHGEDAKQAFMKAYTLDPNSLARLPKAYLEKLQAAQTQPDSQPATLPSGRAPLSGPLLNGPPATRP